MYNGYNNMHNHVTGVKNMTRYPGGKHNDCDHYDHGKCREKKAKKGNQGKCDGHKTDCIYWEITG